MSEFKSKAKHELVEFTGLFLYLAFFFFALAAYSELLMHDVGVHYFIYSLALINAAVIAKVILIGDYAHVGRRFKNSSLLTNSIYKAVVFSCLVIAFHFVEEAIKRLIHGEGLVGTLRSTPLHDLLGRGLVIFCTFIPLFAFRQIRQVMGEKEFNQLMLHKKTQGS